MTQTEQSLLKDQANGRTLISSLHAFIGSEVTVRGWVYRLRTLSKTSFILLKDCSGELQCVAATETLKDISIKIDDAIEIKGVVRADSRAKIGYELDIHSLQMLNSAVPNLPFTSSSDIRSVGIESIMQYRPLALRSAHGSNIFKVQAAILRYFREFLTQNLFSEVVTSKIVASGTEGGTNLFQIKYFERVAYLAQSPQFYKEHCVAGLERVFETGHVYRAEPHATSRHLTEYYSLDLEFGFIDGPEDVIQLERRLLTYIFEKINEEFADLLKDYRSAPLPSMMEVPTWEFRYCLSVLKEKFGRTDLIDDLDPEGERQLCRIAEEQNGVPAVFVIGYPLMSRPFYTAPRGDQGDAQSFDLLFNGLEITTGGQRLHRRADLEAAIRGRDLDPATFESHLKMFDIGMPPHGGLAIGLERLTMQILSLSNIREAVLYPRDRYRVTP